MSGRPDRRMHRLVGLSFLAGTLLRVGTVLISSPEFNLPFADFYALPSGHGNYRQWARHATAPDGGFFTIYTVPPDPEVKVRLSFGETWVHHGLGEIANYPPLGIHLVYLEGLAHRYFDPELVANTAIARAVFDAIAFLCDIILALGVWRLATLLFGSRAGGVACIIVYWLPPIWLDSCWWGQTDSWVLAPMVWVVWAMVRRRWLLAGLLWGVALSLKPQAVLLAPAWAFVGLIWLARMRTADSGIGARRNVKRIVIAVVLAVVVLNVTALPFWLTSGDAWFRESYLRNLKDEAPYTTLKAFNVWYIDLLLSYDGDVHATLGGISKDAWGKLMAMGGLALSATFAWRSRLPPDRRVVLFVGLWLLSVVMLPTRVHERYIVMCLPFLVVMAVGLRRLWPGLIGVMVMATFQLLVYQWMPLGADAWTRKYRDGALQYHRNVVAATPPELLYQVPTREEALELGRREFIKTHWRGTASLEWVLAITGVASASILFAGAVPRRRESVKEV